MAHRFAYKPTGFTLTSSLPEYWNISVDGDFVDVKLTAPGNIVLLQERYYAYNGTVKLYDIASLIESSLRASGMQHAVFDFALLDTSANVVDSCSFNVIYCDRFAPCTDTNNFLTENFLTTLNIRRVAKGSGVTLSFFCFQDERTDAVISYRWRDLSQPDDIRADSYIQAGTLLNSASMQQISLAQSSIINDACQKYSLSTINIEIVSYTVSVGQRSITFFVDRSLRDVDCFFFRNCFNVWEVAHFPYFTTVKTEVERSSAVVNRQSKFYDQHTEKSYQVQSGTLTSDEAEWIDQLFTSYEVMRLVPNDFDDTEPYLFEQVLISDASCEVHDGDEKPNTVKFTWRYADNRAIVRLTASLGIFTSPYNIVFS